MGMGKVEPRFFCYARARPGAQPGLCVYSQRLRDQLATFSTTDHSCMEPAFFIRCLRLRTSTTPIPRRPKHWTFVLASASEPETDGNVENALVRDQQNEAQLYGSTHGFSPRGATKPTPEWTRGPPTATVWSSQSP